MKPKILLCLALVLSGVLCGCCNLARCAGQSSAIKVAIDIPEIWTADKLARPRTLGNRTPDAHFFVIIENTSSKPLLITRGNGRIIDLYFIITGADGKTTVVRQMHPAYSAYVNDEVRLAPGQPNVAEICYVRAGDGYAFPFPAGGQSRKVTIRAVLELKPFEGAAKAAIWTGKVVSEPYEVVLENDAL
jgi:hypothetical protein